MIWGCTANLREPDFSAMPFYDSLCPSEDFGDCLIQEADREHLVDRSPRDDMHESARPHRMHRRAQV